MLSVKISELQSLTTPTENDVLLMTDLETKTSRKCSFSDLKMNIERKDMGDYEQQQHEALHEGLASGFLYVNNLTIGAE